MKVKEIARTANIAWSPAEQHPVYIAAGTAAQQLDATFRSVSQLTIEWIMYFQGSFQKFQQFKI